MARRLISIISLISSFCFGAEFQIANRADINVMDWRYSLPLATYTNLLASTNSVWLTGAGNGTNVFNFIGSNPHAAIVGSPCLTFGGADYVSKTTTVPLGGNVSWRIDATVISCTKADTTYDGTIFSFGIGAVQEFCIAASSTKLSIQRAGQHVVSLDLLNITYPAEIYADYNAATSNVTVGIVGGSSTNITLTPFVFTTNNFILRPGMISWSTNFAPSFFIGQIAETKFTYNGSVLQHLVYTENSGTKIYDVSGNGNHGTLTTASETLSWANTQNVAAYFPNYGGVTWSSGSTNRYVPNTISGVPATNSVAGFTVARTNLTKQVHNRGPYSLLFGGVTNTYSMMLTNAVSITTNATGQIGAYAK